MAERIKITPSQVRSVASTFKQKSQESTQMVSQLESQVNAMQPEWEGMTSEKFYNEFASWRNTMKQFTQLLESIGTQLDAIATQFEGLDRS